MFNDEIMVDYHVHFLPSKRGQTIYKWIPCGQPVILAKCVHRLPHNQKNKPSLPPTKQDRKGKREKSGEGLRERERGGEHVQNNKEGHGLHSQG